VVPNPHLQLAFTVFGGYNADLQALEVNNLANTPLAQVVVIYGIQSEKCSRRTGRRQKGENETEV